MACIKDKEWKAYKCKYNKDYDSEEDNERREIYARNKKLMKIHNQRYEDGKEKCRRVANELTDMAAYDDPRSLRRGERGGRDAIGGRGGRGSRGRTDDRHRDRVDPYREKPRKRGEDRKGRKHDPWELSTDQDYTSEYDSDYNSDHNSDYDSDWGRPRHKGKGSPAGKGRDAFPDRYKSKSGTKGDRYCR
ncbi:uncharacterized protein LOC119659643 [Hermetia illucens]|uniref:uncharacterized protein LOC119659643 n=1 Tax=Hermetia illucens TaxID=343691 RepID=UPI0018CC0AC6|nr:uncharacterized protein LOC119659643 [Hermetia illucens]